MSLRSRLTVVPVLTAILVAACSSATGTRPAGAQGKQVCELLQGAPDVGLNRAVQNAVAFAHSRLGVRSVIRAATVPGVGPFLNGRCALILAAGYDEAAPVFTTASKYSRQRFLLADDWFEFSSAPDLTRRNVSVVAFEADQASFLAGYVAAAVSQNHVVGEYGSANTPTVDVALNGFLAGARAYGEDSGKHVRILGWDGSRGTWAGNDSDRQTTFSITTRMIQSGAHVIFGVTGGGILGSAAAAAVHPSVYLIGMYTDEYTAAPQYANKWLTSVVFDMRSPVLSAIRAATGGGFAGGLYAGTVANGGVSLASFHRLAHLVPRALIAKLRTLRAGLSQGWISTNPAVYVPVEKETGSGNG